MRDLLERIRREHNKRDNQSAGRDPNLHPLRNIVRINLNKTSAEEMQDLYEKGLLNQEGLYEFDLRGRNSLVRKIAAGEAEAAIFLLYHGFNPHVKAFSNGEVRTSDWIKSPLTHISYRCLKEGCDNVLNALDFAERRLSGIDFINKGDAAGLIGLLKSFINKQVKFKINAEEVTRNEIDLVQKDFLKEAIYKNPEMIVVLLENGIDKGAKIKYSIGNEISILSYLIKIKKQRWFKDNKDVMEYINDLKGQKVNWVAAVKNSEVSATIGFA